MFAAPPGNLSDTQTLGLFISGGPENSKGNGVKVSIPRATRGDKRSVAGALSTIKLPDDLSHEERVVIFGNAEGLSKSSSNIRIESFELLRDKHCPVL
jgi:hypothetical protein